MINTRERNLMIVVAAIAGSYGLFLVVRTLFLGPLETQATQIRSLANEIASKKKQMEEAITASSRLSEWEKRSLPGDEGVSLALYQKFLIKLMSDCDFEDPQISAEKTHKTKYYTSVPFTIRGRVSLEKLTEFLYRLASHEPQVLHQVRSLSITRGTDSRKSLSVTIIVAALALNTAPHRTSLIEGDDFGKVEIADRPRERYGLIAAKNIFEPFREPPKAPERPQVDAARFVIFSGCTQSGGKPVAWIYNRLTNENKHLRDGDDFDIAGIKGKVITVDASGLVIERDGKQWSLKLGKNLGELKEIGPAVAASESSEGEPAPANSVESPANASEAATERSESTSAEKLDKIRATIPVKKEAVAPEHELTKAGSGS